MKIILTGATGLIGSAVLQRLISLPTITSIIVLSRRELPTKHPKIQTIIIHDFLHGYSPDVLASIQGAEACIWVLGSPTSGREVHHDMTMAATKAFSENCVEQVGKDSGGGGQKAFRFVYTSGSLVVTDQNAQTWFMGDGRKMRGEVETNVIEMEKQHSGSWKSYIVRPSLVTTGEPIYKFLLGGNYIPKEELAATMVDLAVNGGDQQTLNNAELKQRGKDVLRQT